MKLQDRNALRSLSPMVLLVHLVVFVIVGSAFADGTVPGEAIVVIQPGVTIEEVIADHAQFGPIVVLASIDQPNTHRLLLPEGWDEDTFEETLEDDERIEEAELSWEFDTVQGQTQSFYLGVPAEDYGNQYTPGRINLFAANSITRGAGAVVAILDTGIDPGHPTLAGMLLASGYDFVDGDADPIDAPNGLDDDADGEVDELYGHGTFMAGLVALVAPEASILMVRVLDSDGAGNVFSVAAGIYYAVDQGADVINLSLTVTDDESLVQEAIAYAAAAGVTVVASAGNLDSSDETYLAEHDDAIGVAGTDENDIKSPFSNYGDHVSISAPGSAIVSSVPGGEFGEWEGTSMSAALVSGAAALIKAVNVSATPAAIRAAIMDTAVDIDAANPQFAGQLGAGRLDVGAAVASMAPAPTGDVNGDASVDFNDLLLLLAAWGSADFQADLDGNGVVGFQDLLLLLANWS